MGKILKIFDFDDTLVRSSNKVRIIHADGDESILSSHDFAMYSEQPGDQFDFSEFEKYPKTATVIKEIFVDLLSASTEAQSKVIILTARSNAQPVVSFLLDHNVSRTVEVIAVGSANPIAKGQVVDSFLSSGEFSEVFVYEDNLKNIKEIEKVTKGYDINFGYQHVKTKQTELLEDFIKEVINKKQQEKDPGAGIIVLKKFDNMYKILGLRLYGGYDFPKGKIEANETPFEAAIRETFEEASISNLNFPWGLNPITVVEHLTLFIGTTEDEPKIRKNPETGIYEHHGAKWLDWNEALQKFTSYLRPALGYAKKITEIHDI
ncbi:hypothetical protein CL614_07910 [archaeon]|nr:hypothetical protein [archaeon]